MHRRFSATILILLAAAACERPPVASPERAGGREGVRVVTDGRFDEWSDATFAVADPADAPADAAVDLGEVRVVDDPRFLHLSVEVGRPVNAQRMRGTLRIAFDSDGDPATGAEVLGLDGVDAVAELSRRDRDPSDEHGAGIGIRPVTSEGPGEISSGYAVGLLSAPTWSAPRFEVRLERGRVPGGGGFPLFIGQALRFRLVFEDATGIRDETEAATYYLTTPYIGDPPGGGPEPSLRKSEGAVRFVAWNVAGEALRERPEPFSRILAALDPDVILLDEVYGTVAREDLERFFAREPLAALGAWELVLGRGGGRQKNVVATRRPIRPVEELLEVAYPPESLERLGAEVGDAEFSGLLELERRRGVATAGAWVSVDGRSVLCVPLDLQSGGYDGSPADRLRELQASTLRERIAAVLEASDGGAVVIGGDLNLVGSRRPLDLLRQGLDAGADLAVAEAYRLTDRSQATWRDVEQGEFTPGRLDFLLYSASSFRVERAFPFDSAELSDAHLALLGVERADSRISSRHLPVVGDVRWK